MVQVVEMEEGLRCALAFADPWALHVVSDSSLNVYRYTLEEKGINGLQTQIVKRQFRIAQWCSLLHGIGHAPQGSGLFNHSLVLAIEQV
jgi:hypothetical protein